VLNVVSDGIEFGVSVNRMRKLAHTQTLKLVLLSHCVCV